MKKYILKSALACVVIMMAASCETTEYNDANFGDLGYNSDPEVTDVQTLAITLTESDYKAIASDATNKYMAEKAGVADELAAISTNQYFSENITANEYLPAYLESLYGSYLSLGSKINVTYNISVDAPAVLAYIMSGTAYTVTADDYASVWGDEASASYFTPSKSAESNLPAILKSALPDAAGGDYALVTYSYSDFEPSTGESGGTEEEDKDDDDVTETIVATFDGSELPTEYTDDATVITVNGIEFTQNKVANYQIAYPDNAGPIQFAKSVSYVYNNTAIEGLSKLVITLANSYNNFTVYAGTEMNPQSTVVEASTEDLVVTYTLPAGTTFVSICNAAGYTAYATKFEFVSAQSSAADMGSVCVTFDGSELPTEYTDDATAITVSGMEFTQNKVANYQIAYPDNAGPIQFAKSVSYVYNNTAIEGLSKLVITLANSYNNFTVYAGTEMNPQSTVVEASTEDLVVTYTLPAGTTFVSICNVAGYTAYANKFEFYSTSASSSAPAKASAATTALNAVYLFDGSKWAEAANTVMLNAADYTAMGSTYGNLSGTQPETYIPIYLNINYPYALDGDSFDVVYKYYGGSSTDIKASRFDKVGSEWVMNNNIESETGPFENMESGWIYNPSMIIEILPGYSPAVAAIYYQKTVDIVGEVFGEEYVTSYGNNEYYCGTSAYYGNVDWSWNDLTDYWSDAGEDISAYSLSNGTDAIVALYDEVTARFGEAFALTLGEIHPDVNVVDGLDILYTVKIAIYFGKSVSSTNHNAVFKVVGPGEYEFVELVCTDSAYDIYSEANLKYVYDMFYTE
ncbi:MAG: hypothetical protein R3Y08_06065 [Rikenellaceae bacterium]